MITDLKNFWQRLQTGVEVAVAGSGSDPARHQGGPGLGRGSSRYPVSLSTTSSTP